MVSHTDPAPIQRISDENAPTLPLRPDPFTARTRVPVLGRASRRTLNARQRAILHGHNVWGQLFRRAGEVHGQGRRRVATGGSTLRVEARALAADDPDRR